MRRKIISGLSNQATFFALLALLLFPHPPLHAQAAGTGSIQGTVTDATGAVVQAIVTLTETSTLVKRTAPPATAAYTFPNVQSAPTTLKSMRKAFRPTPAPTSSLKSAATSLSMST